MSATGSQSEPKFCLGQMVRVSARPEFSGAVVAIAGDVGRWTYSVFCGADGFLDCLEDQLILADVPDRTGRPGDFRDLSALLTATEVLAPSRNVVHAVNAGRIDFIPYQYRPVLKVVRADQPRLLIADEVGVGKTIEAGLVLKELKARIGLRSVAVICPKALAIERKWESEMRRFGEYFRTLSSSDLTSLLRSTDIHDGVPPGSEQVVIPFSALQSEEVLLGKPGGHRVRPVPGLREVSHQLSYDLVIVDEAHRARNPSTNTHEAVRLLCDQARAVLLLTATPLQMGQSDLFTLLKLLRPDLISTLRSFEQMAEPNAHITTAAEYVRAGGDDWASRASLSLRKALATAWGSRVLAKDYRTQEVLDALAGSLDDSDRTRVSLTRRIEDLHTFSHLVNRTRRRDIDKFTVRRPETIRVDFTAEQRSFHDAVVDFVGLVHRERGTRANLPFLLSGIRRQAASCAPGLARRLRDLVSQPDRAESDSDEAPDSGDLPPAGLWDLRSYRRQIEYLANLGLPLIEGPDPKFEALLEAIKHSDTTGGKVLVFATYRHTLTHLAERLSEAGIRAGMITGAVPDDDRVVIRERFSRHAADPFAIEVLLCSEVGSEGLDFQFCSTIANYDLPWNPMRVEQRIGRIDRYGQSADYVSIWNLTTRGTLDDEIYERCLRRIGIFEATIGATEEILGQVTEGLERLAFSTGLTAEEEAERLQQIADNAIRRTMEVEALQSEESKFFGLRVAAADEDEVRSSISPWLAPRALLVLLNGYLRSLGHADEDPLTGLDGSITLSPDVRRRLRLDAERLGTDRDSEQWLQLLDKAGRNLRVALSADAAREEPRVELLHPTHPLVRCAANSAATGGHLRVNLSAGEACGLPPGRYTFGVWRWRRLGIREESETVWVTPSADPAEVAGAVASADSTHEGEAITATEVAELEGVHRQVWSAGREIFQSAVARAVAARIREVDTETASEVARLEAIARATDDIGIRRMRASQVEASKSKRDDMVARLVHSRNQADVLTQPLAMGVLQVKG